MEVSALRYSGGIGLHGRSPLLKLQSDERLIAFIRRGNSHAFEVLFSRYQTRLLAFCRHLLGSREDAEDILQEVMAAAFNAILADERPINVRPWLYRIARNRSLNHLRRAQAIGVDSMDIHLSENGATTADKVHDREQFRLLVGDIQQLPETQRTALVLREMDALSYEQIAEAMETTVPGVKSLLVRARIALAEAAEARQLSCEDVRIELAEVAEGIRKRPGALVRRHLRSCRRCSGFQGELKRTNRALAALLPLGPLALLRKVLILHLSHSAGTGSGAAGGTAASAAGGTAAGGTAAGGTAAGGAAAGTTAAGATAGATSVGVTAAGTSALGSATGVLSAGAGALAGKAAAGLAAAAIVTAGAVEASHVTRRLASHSAAAPVTSVGVGKATLYMRDHGDRTGVKAGHHHAAKTTAKPATKANAQKLRSAATIRRPLHKRDAKPTSTKTEPGRTQTQTDATVLSPQPDGQAGSSSTSSPAVAGSGTPGASSSDGSSTTTSSSTSSSGTTTSPSATTGTTGPTGATGPTGPTSGAGATPDPAAATPTTATTPAS